jgi:3-oxoacyl-[acyl-carrier-protein] synthase II
MKRRVVITGMGAVTPLGLDIPSFNQALKNGLSGISKISRFETSCFPVKYAGEVKNFNAASLKAHALDPFIQYALSATTQALKQSEIDLSCLDPYRIGLSVSSSKGGLHTFNRLNERFKKKPSARLGAHLLMNLAPNFAATRIARRWKINGPSRCYIAACATGTVAIAEGYRMVRDGEVDFCIAGASDASIVPFLLGGYQKMKVMAKEKMKPFEKTRDGFLIGEGAGIVVLETLENARARKVKILAEIKGYQYGTDSQHPLHFSETDDVLSHTIKTSLENADLTTKDIQYVNLHGTATLSGDLYETRQIKKAFVHQADQIPMSSTKSMTGHMLGASGAVEIIACALAMNDSFLPPTINMQQPDGECDLDYVANQSRKAKIENAMTVSMGFGGHAVSLILGKAS